MQNTRMTCPLQTDNADVLLDYCARALDAERTAMLELHMRSCEGCRAMAADQAHLWAAMDSFEAETISADFDRKLYARIAETDQVPAWERFWAPVREYLQGQPAWKPVLSIAAASALFIVVIAVRSDVPPPAVEPAAVVLDAGEVEQAEHLLEDLDMLRQLEAAAPADASGANAQKEVL